MTHRDVMPHSISTYYLAGPMAGYPEHNHPAFHVAAAKLRACGHTIISPAEFGRIEQLGWAPVMKRDIHALLWCDAVIVMPGWEKSRGARLETGIAWDLDMPIYLLETMLCDCIRPGNDAPIWHTDSCIDRRMPISVVPADDLTNVVMYARTHSSGEVQAAAGRLLPKLEPIIAPVA